MIRNLIDIIDMVKDINNIFILKLSVILL